MNAKLVLFTVSGALCLMQLLAAVPWLLLVDARAMRSFLRQPKSWLMVLGGLVVGAAALGLFMDIVEDPATMVGCGRVYGAVLHAQLTIDVIVLLFPVLMTLWPQGAAVALAAFREGVRQPMFWLIMAFAVGLLLFSPFLPYFTFGEDMKMVRQIGYDTIMLASVLFGVLASSMSISEEIEGRTAITVMSKPISRRQFLIGKFVGTLLAVLLMTCLLGWLFNGVQWFKLWFDRETITEPFWANEWRSAYTATLGSPLTNFAIGARIWFEEAFYGTMPGLVFGFCQAMVLLAIAVGFATRLPMVVNLVTCLLVFFLGHLTHVLVRVSEQRYALINFMAKVFENVLPGLEYFDLSRLLVRDIPPDAGRFSVYLLSVVGYAVLYSVIALLFGLILFEDRDLA